VIRECRDLERLKRQRTSQRSSYRGRQVQKGNNRPQDDQYRRNNRPQDDQYRRNNRPQDNQYRRSRSENWHTDKIDGKFIPSRNRQWNSSRQSRGRSRWSSGSSGSSSESSGDSSDSLTSHRLKPTYRYQTPNRNRYKPQLQNNYFSHNFFDVLTDDSQSDTSESEPDSDDSAFGQENFTDPEN
jgi:hypothetical protein